MKKAVTILNNIQVPGSHLLQQEFSLLQDSLATSRCETGKTGQSGDWEDWSVWGLGRLVSLGTGKTGQSGDWEGWSVWGLGRLVSLGTGKAGQSGDWKDRVSDPAIGGTYMTLLNTVANIAVAIPKTVVLWLVDVVSFKDCTGVTDFNLDCDNYNELQNIPDSCSYVSDRGGSTARAISVVAIFSSLLSCMGSVLIVYVYLRWPAVRSGSRAIITYLAIADFVTGFGYIMGSSNYLQYTSYGNVTAMPESTKDELCYNLFTPVCKIQSFLTTSSSMMSFLWTLILAIYLHTTVVKNRIRLAQQLVPLYHVVAWGLPTVVIFVMLATDVLGYAPVASANWCFIGVIGDNTVRIAMIMVGGKFLEIITYVVALVLFVSTSIRLRIQKDGTLQSRDQAKVAMIQQVDRKLLFIPIVFILLRIWGTLEFIFTEVYSKYFCTNSPAFLGVLSALRFLQAIGDGGQGWGNAILYIFNSPKIRNLLLKDLTTCCSRTANILNRMKVKTKDYEATTTSKNVRMSVQDESLV
ncbi:hypothetical protein EMCRGX_G016797 [Ephydatia muelleri]